MPRSGSPWYHPFITVTTIVVVGALLSVGLAWSVIHQERVRTDAAFDKTARQHITAIEQTLRQEFASVGKVADLFRLQRIVTREHFQRLARSVLARHEALHTIAWIPRVTHLERETFVARARGGWPGYAIRDRNPLGELVAAERRPVYFPVLFIAPQDGNEGAIGVDPGDDTVRTEALHGAIARGQLTVSAPTTARIGGEAQTAFMVFAPVGDDFIDGRLTRVDGLAQSVILVEPLLNRALSVLHSNGLRLSLTDTSAASGTPPFAERMTGSESVPWYMRPGRQTLASTREIAGRSMEIAVSAEGAAFAYDLRPPVAATALGLALTGLTSWLVALLSRRERRVRALARCRDLQLQHLHRHDALTGLLNRIGFQEEMEAVLSRVRARNTTASLCFIDLDQFKLVNDVCGHEAGDELLRRIAGRLTDTASEATVVARLGGDEFGVLLYGHTAAEGAGIAQDYRRHIEATRFSWGQRVLPVTASVGVVEINRYTPSIATAMSQADAACHIAKEHGRNRLHTFHEDDHLSEAFHQQMRWVSALREALDENRLELYLQRIYPATTQRSGHAPPMAEILLRLRERDGRLIPPSIFLPAAERYGVIPSIDRWVVAQTIRELAEHGQDSGQWFINLSGQTLGDLTFCEFILHCLHHHRVSPRMLCFEVTETAVVSSFATARIFMRRLREAGCCFALDDFGSGMSSFHYLKELPVDYLKIDGGFIRELPDNRLDFAVAGAIQRLANELGLTTIAEFVEDESVFEAVRELGVDHAQGYHLGHPAPLEQFLRSRSRPRFTVITGGGDQ
ncbi:putative bifunctional diguanylate cyclase/phosphodiesterase [Arhodomonas sp. AD133]|uniref:putative bifunctional diguanylate cyclase/phosphodiesterase n=1 Tax=Arhodomonas sp. AD133 TaxID=3415009 RepID=UPI003EB71486